MVSNLDLEGKVAFITGSTRGIGWAAACALAREQATVILNGSSSQEALEERSEELRTKFGVNSFGILADAGEPSEVKACYQRIFKRCKGLDILVNNAGLLEDSIVGMISEESVRRIFSVNTFGAIHHLQSASRLMLRGGSGSIINIASIVGQRGNPGQLVYSASKAALIGMTLSASKELSGKNVRVNAVSPGYIETELVKYLDPKKHQEMIAGITMGRIGTPEDVADVILFLASDLSRYVTGQVINVDGGLVI